MLASLLPGLREVRTPLTVGYLWVLIGWVSFAEKIPRKSPGDGGLIARLFDLEGILGKSTAIAALSFSAYIIGAVLTLPVEGSLATGLLRRLSPRVYRPGQELGNIKKSRLQRFVSSDDEITTRFQFERRLTALADKAAKLPDDVRVRAGLGSQVRLETFEPLLSDLRIRLLAANSEMYGEYDRYAAEGSFRLNVVAPLLVLGGVAVLKFGVAWGLVLFPVVLVLLVQGVNRLRQARMVLWRAVVRDIVELPAEAQIREAQEIAAQMG